MSVNDLIKTGNNGSASSSGLAALRASAAGSAERMSQEFRDLISDLEGLIKKSKTATGKELEEVKEALDGRVAEAKILMEDQSNAMSKRAKEAYNATSGYVREHPVASSTGLLVGLSALCGYLWWRQR
ncbi:DUF883 family protein [Marinimicrobium locisalis]|uniref:DUF883 family protein n=1 Tax=Marinimicrobium locisalis TaxID=546022 RepID=UPI00322149CE